MKAFASLIATVAFAAGAFASSTQAGDANRSWQMSGADAYVHVEPQSPSLNGHMVLGGLTGGVGNTFGSHCCSSGGGFFIVTGSTRRGDGADGDIAFRQARDAAFGQSFGGPAIDRAFRFRANRIQRSGF
jgi:hypothetical protein